ncbi:MAG: hypothetical protein JW940_04220 [Polyangiaceae bacterium]|nr:hypothetical protein [Polyangiaceae bacterium]
MAVPGFAEGDLNSTHQPKVNSVMMNASHAIDGRCLLGTGAAFWRMVMTGCFFGRGGGAAFTLGGARSLTALDSPILGTGGGARFPSDRPKRLSVLFSLLCLFGSSLGASERREGVLIG